MKLRSILKIHVPVDGENATVVKAIKDRAERRMRDVQQRKRKFSHGTVKFRYGSFGDYERTKDFKTDWIMYRRALSDVIGCELEQLDCSPDTTLRPKTIVIELYLEGE